MIRHNRLTLLGAPLGTLAITIAFSATFLAAPVSAAPAPITFDMTIYGNCVSGWTGGGDVDVVWRDSYGALKAEGTVTDRWWTWFEFCPADATLAVLPGDQIKVSNGFDTRKYVIPDLTITLDRVNNMATGTGPAGRTIRICSGWSWLIFGDECHSVRVGQDGRWSYNPHTDVYGGIVADITWKSPKSDRLYVNAVAPFLGVTIGKAGFTGFTRPLANVDVSLDGSIDGVGHSAAGATGAFDGILRDSGSSAVPVSPGDHVTAPSLASDADWIVPTISGNANKLTEVVRGACLNYTGNHQVRVSIVGPLGTVRGRGFWHVGTDGRFKATFVNYFAGGDVPVTTNIKSGDEVWIDCLQPTWDYARLSFIVP